MLHKDQDGTSTAATAVKSSLPTSHVLDPVNIAFPKKQSKGALPQIQRFITTHDESGKAVYSSQLPETLPSWPVGPPADPAFFALAYASCSMPVPLTEGKDLAEFSDIDHDRTKGGLVKRGGSVVRYVDYPPNGSSPMHRTVSCDYAIVIQGRMNCLLDSGESRTLEQGDILIQRGTMHQWINHSDDWARMLYILLDAAPVVSDGVALGEELGGMEGVPESS